jgi:hypothetical protein
MSEMKLLFTAYAAESKAAADVLFWTVLQGA